MEYIHRRSLKIRRSNIISFLKKVKMVVRRRGHNYRDWKKFQSPISKN